MARSKRHALLDFFETIVVPALASKSKNYLTCLRCAVRRFGKLFPGTSASEIDRELLDAFQSQLTQSGCNQRTAKAYRGHVAIVVRHCDSHLLPDNRYHRRSEIENPDELDEDMLHVVYKQRFAPQRLLGKSDRTKYFYPLAIYNLGHFLGRPARLSDLTDENVTAMMTWIGENGRSERTVNNNRDYILAFWRWCARKRLVEEFPDVEKLPEPDVMPTSWSQEQLARLFEGCANQTGEIGGVKACDWWLAIHNVWWDTGERTGATLQIEWEHFDSASGQLWLPGSIRKTNKRAYYCLKPQTVVAVELIRAPERKLIFEFPWNIGTFYHRYTRLLKDAGLPHGRRDKPQKMRRSFASHLEAAGGNATDALQHSSRSVTKNSYLDERVVKTVAPNLLLFDVALPKADGERNGNGKPADDREKSGDEKPAATPRTLSPPLPGQQ